MTTTSARIRLKLLTVDAKMLGSNPVIVAIAVGGAKYQLRHQLADMAAAERLADRIAARGTIDATLWDIVGVAPKSRAATHLRAEANAEQARNAAYVEARLAA